MPPRPPHPHHHFFIISAEQLEFEDSDDFHNEHKAKMIEDYVTKNYVDISYKVKSVNPKKELIVAVETDGTLLQWVDLRAETFTCVWVFIHLNKLFLKCKLWVM